jgi:acyl-CoA thioester hydrolase
MKPSHDSTKGSGAGEASPVHKTRARVIYGDTDNMGMAYHANYFRWFEIGRTEYFRALGLSYREIEVRGVFLPVSEAFCKFVTPARYDDLLTIETTLDRSFRSGVRFEYRLLDEAGSTLMAKGFTKHACLNPEGKVIRPPAFLWDALKTG